MWASAGQGSGSAAVQRHLDAQLRLAQSVSEGLDVAVVAVAAAVEHDGVDAGSLGALGQQRARTLGALGFAERAQLGLVPVDRSDRAPGAVVDQLRGDAAV